MVCRSESTQEQLQLGTCIDGGALELVEVLGIGGYGVVYRAREKGCSNFRSYAVKSLLHNRRQTSTRRQVHIREIALHQLSSVHPGVVKLHRVVEDDDRTYMIMDYAPDHDLFTQILDNRRYLGNDALIKHVILQLIDAVEYCHSLGIYHRDLKPENVLCFDGGSRIAITDFGLATTEKVSEEMRTGSIYHMSPGIISSSRKKRGGTMFNDVWSLGIIFLNLATGRNPWRTATLDDETFCEYLRNPYQFFQSVLPVSSEVNEILVRVLHLDWMERMTLAEFRQEMIEVEKIYMPGVVFEGNQARCPWEGVATAGRETCIRPTEILKSYWSEDSLLDCDTGAAPSSEWASDLNNLGFHGFDAKRMQRKGRLDVEVGILSSQRSSDSSASSEVPSTPDDADISFASWYSYPATELALEGTGCKQLVPYQDDLASPVDPVLLGVDIEDLSLYALPSLAPLGG